MIAPFILVRPPRLEGLDEHVLYQACRDFDTDDGSTMIALAALILLFARTVRASQVGRQVSPGAASPCRGGALRNGAARFMHLLNQRLLRDPTIAELAQWLIEDFVIVQHERVATAKLPDDTYRDRRGG